jgi:hypothetical protein
MDAVQGRIRCRYCLPRCGSIYASRGSDRKLARYPSQKLGNGHPALILGIFDEVAACTRQLGTTLELFVTSLQRLVHVLTLWVRCYCEIKNSPVPPRNTEQIGPTTDNRQY